MSEITVRETQPGQNKKRRRKWPFLLALALVLLAAALLLLWPRLHGAGNTQEWAETEYVEVASANYFNGVIEPQQTWDIQKDASREVAQVYVSVGQSVTVGQQLFAYATDELSLQLKQARLELDGINNEIDGYGAQISELTAQREQAGSDQQLEYTVQIQEMQSSRQQAELNRQMKQMEIDNLLKSIDSAVVTSTMDGVVKQINIASAEPDQPFMTVLASGAYQVKGTVDEMNVWALYEGMAVNIRSRVDETQVWPGTISRIDTENTVSSNQNVYNDGSTSENQATRYYFYVALNTSDQLLLGQHVYIEPLYDDAAAGAAVDSAPAEGTTESADDGQYAQDTGDAQDGEGADNAQ
ncbi:MAG: efflux RND transporter periplasmic adaptor subunit [Firmicutes bacterium]|nr:efflux RND transporter periplasmic adaptor subunit [Bacillota bacterium]